MKRSLALCILLVAACSPPTPPDSDSTSAALRARAPLTVERSDASGFVVRFRPDVTASQVTLGGTVYDSLSVAGSALPSLPGTPAVPFISRPFALPEGATASVRVVSLRTKRLRDRWLRPTPPHWQDNLDAPNPPVTERPEDYGSTAVFPANVVAMRTGGARLAGIAGGVLQLSVAQFSPNKRQIDLVQELVVEVTFDRAFEQLPSPRRDGDRRFTREFINENLILKLGPLAFAGPEYLIVTDDLFRPAADRLAVWKRQKGISTLVVSTSVIGSTRDAIKSYIQTLYNAPNSQLAYLLLFGDVEFVPTYYRDYSTNPDVEIGTDLPFAKLDGLDAHADIAYGRISVDTLNQANNAVDRTLDYEQTPSRDNAVYDAMAFSGFFEDTDRMATLRIEGMLVTSASSSGNLITLEILEPVQDPFAGYFPNRPLEVTVIDEHIDVRIGTDGNGTPVTSWRDLVTALNADPDAAALVTATEDPDPDGDGIDDHDLSDAAVETAQQSLAGGSPSDGIADRPYIDVLEEIRAKMLGHGKLVDRLYDTNTAFVDGPSGDYDSRSLPPELLEINGFTWDADAFDIQDAINAGRALVWHRDHGGTDGWGYPDFDFRDVDALKNGDIDPADAYEDRYPVMFNISCLTGRFDEETDSTIAAGDAEESFADEMLRSSTDAGVVAVIAASRASSTLKNQFMARGLFDAYWQNVVIGFNRTTVAAPSTFRLGDALIYAKDYQLMMIETSVLGFAYPADEAHMVDQVEMYHLHGDPTLEMWTEAPIGFGVLQSGWRQLAGGGRVFRVQLESAAGTPHVAFWQGDQPAGTARLVSSTARHGVVRRVYELDEPAGVATTVTTLYVTQPGHAPSITAVAP